MNIKKPAFWDLQKPNFYSYVLFPFTFLIRINNFFLSFFPKKKFNQIKTICVGNIYIGGTGKTPTAIKLFQLLKAKRYDLAIGKKYYPNQQDEQILLKNKSSLITHKSREEIIKLAIEKNYKLVIFDDGLQERKFDYDIKFVCFDSKTWIGNGYLIPSGPLRENISSLKKYDGVFLKITDKNTNLEKIISKIKKINQEIEVFNSHIKIKNLDQFDLSDNYLIFSGIGNSKSFKEILTNNKFNIIEEKIFSDHYQYKDKDINQILEISKKNNLKIITTEKDYVKIPNNFKNKMNFVELELIIDDEEKLIKFIESKID